VTCEADRQSSEGATAATALHRVRPEWLGRRVEPVIDPDLPIVDAHHHLWDLPGNRYLTDDYLADLADSHRVIGSIYCQSGTMMSHDGPVELRPVGETAFAAAVADACDKEPHLPRLCAGIIASIDLAMGHDAAPVLAAHAAAAGGRLRGVRCLTHWHADANIHKISTTPGILTTPATRAVARQLQDRGLVLDIWVFHSQLDDVIDLARACPELAIVLDHGGTPLGCGLYAGRRDEVRSDWRRKMAVLAGLPNVRVKLGGFAMRFSGYGFDQQPEPPSSQALAAAWAPYIIDCIELFGAARCMFESNFPVDKTACSYRTLWNAYKRLAAGASRDEKIALFGGTAGAVYGLSIA